VASTDLWGYRLVNESFPMLENFQLAPNVSSLVQIPPNTKIVILSNEGNVLEKANTSLDRVGLRARLIGEERIKQGSIDFLMTFIEVERSR
jgi:hypothetical protein